MKMSERIAFKNCFVDYDGGKTFLITPSHEDQFEVTFDTLNEALVTLKKLKGKWLRKSGKPWIISNPVKYFKGVVRNQKTQKRDEYERSLLMPYKPDFLDDDEEYATKCSELINEKDLQLEERKGIR